MSWKVKENSGYSWSKTYDEIKTRHDAVFGIIDQAISLEEHDKPKEALAKYKEGIAHIDEILSIPVQCPEDPDPTWRKACSMIQKLKKTRAEVLLRLNIIQQSSPDFVPPEQVPLEDPPSYDEAMASSTSEDEAASSPPPRTYQDLAAALHDLRVELNQMQEELVCVHDNVRVYFISPNGEVLSTLEPQTLKIFAINDAQQANAPKAVLQVGTFVYPLVPGVSPCYRTNYGAFILPDLSSTVPGSSVGIILPSDADDDVFDFLESILHGVVSQTGTEELEKYRQRTDVEPPEDYSTRVSNRIVDGAFFISQNLVRGAMKASEFFNKTTPRIINGMPSAQTPTDIPKPISSTVKIVEKTTNTAANVTGFVAEKVGHATMRLGKFLAPHIQTQGTKLLTNGFKMSEEEASNRMKSILTVTAGAVEGFSTVYSGLETSASILGKNLKDNTVKIVHHRYGQPASTLTDDTLTTVGNVYSIAHNSKVLTPKGLAKKSVKDAGRAVVHGYTASHRASTSYQAMMSEDKAQSKSVEKMEVADEEESETENVNKKG